MTQTISFLYLKKIKNIPDLQAEIKKIFSQHHNYLIQHPLQVKKLFLLYIECIFKIYNNINTIWETTEHYTFIKLYYNLIQKNKLVNTKHIKIFNYIFKAYINGKLEYPTTYLRIISKNKYFNSAFLLTNNKETLSEYKLITLYKFNIVKFKDIYLFYLKVNNLKLSNIFSYYFKYKNFTGKLLFNYTKKQGVILDYHFILKLKDIIENNKDIDDINLLSIINAYQKNINKKLTVDKELDFLEYFYYNLNPFYYYHYDANVEKTAFKKLYNQIETYRKSGTSIVFSNVYFYVFYIKEYINNRASMFLQKTQIFNNKFIKQIIYLLKNCKKDEYYIFDVFNTLYMIDFFVPFNYFLRILKQLINYNIENNHPSELVDILILYFKLYLSFAKNKSFLNKKINDIFFLFYKNPQYLESLPPYKLNILLLYLIITDKIILAKIKPSSDDIHILNPVIPRLKLNGNGISYDFNTTELLDALIKRIIQISPDDIKNIYNIFLLPGNIEHISRINYSEYMLLIQFLIHYIKKTYKDGPEFLKQILTSKDNILYKYRKYIKEIKKQIITINLGFNTIIEFYFINYTPSFYIEDINFLILENITSHKSTYYPAYLFYKFKTLPLEFEENYINYLKIIANEIS